ncbi:trypsin, alkaline B-like [Arctopsyche grandis]|uniref:trypsin, alkaline B-like n=1 Tax=Arctopsyche grandis TaxID=121162 RepID=UPI00406D7288
MAISSLLLSLLFCLFHPVFANLDYAKIAHRKIQNGQAADITDVPYIVSILIDPNDDGNFVHTCGGAIIDANSILTAAHCINDRKHQPGIFKVRAGSTFNKNGGQVRDVIKMIIHPNYQRSTFDKDIALLFLSSLPLIKT